MKCCNQTEKTDKNSQKIVSVKGFGCTTLMNVIFLTFEYQIKANKTHKMSDKYLFN